MSVRTYAAVMTGRVFEYPARIAEQDVDLEIPDDWMLQQDICTAAATERHHEQTARKLCAAALVMCWPDAYRQSDCPKYHENVMSFGREAGNFLHSKGATLNDIVQAGNAALQMVLDRQLTEEDLVQAQKNSEARAAALSASASGSTGGADSPPEPPSPSTGDALLS